jgi:NAD(P)-dependent dehydrogenase (short-subunit alcohol dehydrogenase family)
MQNEIKYMLKQGAGRIVNVASMAGIKGVGGGSAYCASKHGVLGLSKSAAIEYGSHNIRVNAVCPGFIETEMIKQVPKKILEFNTLVNPMKRVGNSKEVADSIVWLLSEESSFVNGSSMNIDGGYGNV